MRRPTIRTCSHCGSRRLRIPGLADGTAPDWDNLMPWVCVDCGRKATPIDFDDEAAAEAFRRARHETPRD